MAFENKLGIDNSTDLARIEEQFSKKKAVELFDKCIFDKLEVGTFSALREIHKYLFDEIYDYAGKIRTVIFQKKFPFCTCYVSSNRS